MEDGLINGYINFTNLAKKLQPEISNALFKDVSVNAIKMSFTRISKIITKKYERDFKFQDIKVVYPLSEIIYEDKNILKLISVLYDKINAFEDGYINITTVRNNVTITMNTKYEFILTEMNISKPKVRYDKLGAVILSISDDYFDVAGVTYEVLKELFFHGITLAETVSSYSHITVTMEQQYLNTAFNVLSNKFFGV